MIALVVRRCWGCDSAYVDGCHPAQAEEELPMDAPTTMLPVYLPSRSDAAEGVVFKIVVAGTEYAGDADISGAPFALG